MSAPGWQIVVDAPHQRVHNRTHRLAMDVDPRRRVVSFGLRPISGGDLELDAGAVARSFFDAGEADWKQVASWVSAEATELLAAIAEGVEVHHVWTGDLVVTWSETAQEAGTALYEGVDRILS